MVDRFSYAYEERVREARARLKTIRTVMVLSSVVFLLLAFVGLFYIVARFVN